MDIDKILNSVWDEACDMMEDGGTADISRGEAKKKLLAWRDEEVRKARIDEFMNMPVDSLYTPRTKGNLLREAMSDLWDEVVASKKAETFPYPITCITYPDGSTVELILDSHLEQYSTPEELKELNQWLRGQTRAIEGTYAYDVRRWYGLTRRSK